MKIKVINEVTQKEATSKYPQVKEVVKEDQNIRIKREQRKKNESS